MPRPPTAILSSSSARPDSARAADVAIAASEATMTRALSPKLELSYRQRRIEREPCEQDEAGIAVGLEHRQAVERVIHIESRNLPNEMRGKRDEPEREDQSCTSSPSSDCDQRQGKRVEQREHRLGALTEEQRRRLDADERVVVAILVRVDSVIADHPAYGAGVEQNRRCIETPKGRRPSHERAPGEGE